MQALARHAYEIFPVPRKTRHQGALDWMLGRIELDTHPDYHHDPRPNLQFESLPALWTAYLEGYLHGNMCLTTEPHNVVVVRHEDLVHRPQQVVNALAKLGLRRNNNTFRVIEHSITTRNEHRPDIVALNQQAHTNPMAPRILQKLTERGQSLRRMLGYTYQWQ